MRRRLFASTSVLSLLLCAALVALWVRSCYVTDSFERHWCDVQGRRFFFHVVSYTTQRGGAYVNAVTELRTGDPAANPAGLERLEQAGAVNDTVWEHSPPRDRYLPTVGWSRGRGFLRVYGDNTACSLPKARRINYFG